MQEDQVDRTKVINQNSVGTVFASAEEMDAKRRNTAVIDYLCKLDEARAWIARYTQSEPELQVFLAELPKGESLARIAKHFDPTIKESIHISEKKEYLHTDNINMFLSWLRKIKLSRHFFFEVIDLYEAKNIPKVIYCIHGLAHFLNMRGVTPGIERRRTRCFTAEDTALVQGDLSKIQSSRYDEIPNNMESDECCSPGNTEPNEREALGTSVPSEDADERIGCFIESLLWRDAFEEVMKLGCISIPTLRRFIGDCPNSAVYTKNTSELQRMQREIIAKFKGNYEMQCEKEEYLRSIRLLLENQSILRGNPVTGFPLANDYRLFKRTLYNLLHDHQLLFKMISAGYELPLRTFFPDNTIGDYHFSKLVEYVKHSHSGSEESLELLRKIVCHHFRSSRVFLQLTQLFNDTIEEVVDLNPVNVAVSVYGTNPESKPPLLDEAIRDRNVRLEIVRRATMLIEYLSVRLDYIAEMELPYYVRLFVNSPVFFEDFIEPAILLSKNFIVSELVRYVFYSRDLFETKTMSFEQERLFYYDCKYDRTREFDFSDYSPLKDFLNSERNRAFSTEFIERNKITVTASEFFLNAVSDGKHLAVDISLKEVNNVIVVLKQSIRMMNPVMAEMVRRLEMLRVHPAHRVSEDERALKAEAVPVVIGGMRQEGEGPRVPPGALEVAVKVQRHSKPVCHPQPNSPGYYTQKFMLHLDTQFIDLSDEDAFALDSMLRDLRARLILLIALSTENDLNGILHTTSAAERARYERFAPRTEILEKLKQQVSEDLKFLTEKGIVSAADGHQSLLVMVAKDVFRNRIGQTADEMVMNSETLDALCKKEYMLQDEMKHLYSYMSDLFEAMAVNRSGVFFNRQAEPRSRYGTYRYPLSRMGAIWFDDVDLLKSHVLISMEQPLIFTLELWRVTELLARLDSVGFDELLKMQEDGLPFFDFNGICAVKVNELIDVINEQYINK